MSGGDLEYIWKAYLLINDVESWLVDQSNIQALLTAPQDRIPGAVKHLAEGNHIASSTLDNNFILSGNEFVVIFEEPGLPIFLQDPGNLGSSGEDEPSPTVEEDFFDDSHHLGGIGREVQVGVDVGEAVISEHVVNTCNRIVSDADGCNSKSFSTEVTSVISHLELEAWSADVYAISSRRLYLINCKENYVRARSTSITFELTYRQNERNDTRCCSCSIEPW